MVTSSSDHNEHENNNRCINSITNFIDQAVIPFKSFLGSSFLGSLCRSRYGIPLLEAESRELHKSYLRSRISGVKLCKSHGSEDFHAVNDTLWYQPVLSDLCCAKMKGEEILPGRISLGVIPDFHIRRAPSTSVRKYTRSRRIMRVSDRWYPTVQEEEVF